MSKYSEFNLSELVALKRALIVILSHEGEYQLSFMEEKLLLEILNELIDRGKK